MVSLVYLLRFFFLFFQGYKDLDSYFSNYSLAFSFATVLCLIVSILTL